MLIGVCQGQALPDQSLPSHENLQPSLMLGKFGIAVGDEKFQSPKSDYPQYTGCVDRLSDSSRTLTTDIFRNTLLASQVTQ